MGLSPAVLFKGYAEKADYTLKLAFDARKTRTTPIFVKTDVGTPLSLVSLSAKRQPEKNIAIVCRIFLFAFDEIVNQSQMCTTTKPFRYRQNIFRN